MESLGTVAAHVQPPYCRRERRPCSFVFLQRQHRERLTRLNAEWRGNKATLTQSQVVIIHSKAETLKSGTVVTFTHEAARLSDFSPYVPQGISLRTSGANIKFAINSAFTKRFFF